MSDYKSKNESDEKEEVLDKTEKKQTEENRPKMMAMSRELRLKKTDMRLGDAHVYEAGSDYYLVPTEVGTLAELSVNPDDSRIVLLYNWDDEINAALPTLSQIRDNIRKALWRNGALTKKHAQENNVKRNLTKGAFPYTISVD